METLRKAFAREAAGLQKSAQTPTISKSTDVTLDAFIERFFDPRLTKYQREQTLRNYAMSRNMEVKGVIAMIESVYKVANLDALKEVEVQQAQVNAFTEEAATRADALYQELKDTPTAGRPGGSMGYREQTSMVSAPTQTKAYDFQKSYSNISTKDFGSKLTLQKGADGHVYLEGFASDDSLDRDGDSMSRKALESMKQVVNSGNLNVFTDHGHGAFDTLGVFTKADISGGKLWVQARMEDPTKNPKVAQLLHKLETGERIGFSIGGDMVGSHWEESKALDRKKVRVIDDVKLYEISVVGLPSNQNALITGSKRF